MQVFNVENYEKLSRMAAGIIAELIKSKPDCVLGLATGSSPLGTYRNLVEKNKAGEIDFSGVKTVNLDEYATLSGSHPQSYRFFMDSNLFNLVNIDKNNTFVPNGQAENAAAECQRYDALICQLGGTDLQLLGIGLDGHIGFNEPDDCFIKNTHIVDLHPSTIEANSRFFESADTVPRQAFTMGIGSIMQAKKILLIANGQSKKEVVERAINGPITPRFPASVLQLHPDVTIIYSEN